MASTIGVTSSAKTQQLCRSTYHGKSAVAMWPMNGSDLATLHDYLVTSAFQSWKCVDIDYFGPITNRFFYTDSKAVHKQEPRTYSHGDSSS